jgi:hypothetical protein
MDRDPRAIELANLKDALANFEHQLDLFEARMGCPPKPSPAHEPVSNDARIAFANDVVAAMKNRMSEHYGMTGLRREDFS